MVSISGKMGGAIRGNGCTTRCTGKGRIFGRMGVSFKEGI